MSDYRECSICPESVNFSDIHDMGGPCYYCDKVFCENCISDDTFLLFPDNDYTIGMCYNCALEEKAPKNSSVYFSTWIKIHKEKEEKEHKIQEKDTYIKQLEAEIELLKTMIQFQPGGDGYFATSSHFKELASDQNK